MELTSSRKISRRCKYDAFPLHTCRDFKLDSGPTDAGDAEVWVEPTIVVTSIVCSMPTSRKHHDFSGEGLTIHLCARYGVVPNLPASSHRSGTHSEGFGARVGFTRLADTGRHRFLRNLFARCVRSKNYRTAKAWGCVGLECVVPVSRGGPRSCCYNTRVVCLTGTLEGRSCMLMLKTPVTNCRYFLGAVRKIAMACFSASFPPLNQLPEALIHDYAVIPCDVRSGQHQYA